MNIWGHVGAEWGGQKPWRSRLRGSGLSRGVCVTGGRCFFCGRWGCEQDGCRGGRVGGGLGGKMKETGGRWSPVREAKSVIKMRAEEK